MIGFNLLLSVTNLVLSEKNLHFTNRNHLVTKNPLVTFNAVINNRDLLTQFILDCTSVSVAIYVNFSPEDCHNVETISRHLCFALYEGLSRSSWTNVKKLRIIIGFV